jgi:hypothetical protein
MKNPTKRVFSGAGAAALYATLAAGIVAGPRPVAAQTNVLPPPPSAASTIPASGDVNPYGVAFVPSSVPAGGALQQGGILVSNFNNNQNLQGTGSTIVQISSQGKTSLFFTSNVGAHQVGLTAALGILSNGIVIVGYLPTFDGTSNTIINGGLIFMDRHGTQPGVLSNTNVSGPWGMALYDHFNGSAQLFVSNVLTGNVTRLDITYGATGESVGITDTVTVASGFSHALDPAALVVGPSGLAFDSVHDILYVASEVDSAVYSIPLAATRTTSAGTGTLIYQDFTHLHGPLDLAMSPNGHLLVANSDGRNADPNQPSELVEFTTGGQFLTQFSVDPNNGGAFGLAIESIGWGTIRMAAVDDNQNSLSMWTTVVH